MEFDGRSAPNGTVLILGLQYLFDTGTGTEVPDVVESGAYTYILLKAGGLWYASGTGRAPQAAGWGAVQRWLEKDGRKLVTLERVTGTETIWSAGETTPV